MNLNTALLRSANGQSQQQYCSQMKYLRWKDDAYNRSSYQFLNKFRDYRHQHWPTPK